MTTAQIDADGHVARRFINQDIIGLINDVARILSLRRVGNVNFKGLRWQNIPPVNQQQVKDFLVGLPPTCQRLDSMPKIMRFLIQLAAAKDVCPVVRYMYPLEQTYNTHVFEGIFGWMYPGSAEPTLFNNQTNCVAATSRSDSVTGLEVTCTVLGLPILYLELFLPIIFLRAILPHLRPGLAKFWSLFIYFFEEIVEAGVEVVAVLFKVFTF